MQNGRFPSVNDAMQRFVDKAFETGLIREKFAVPTKHDVDMDRLFWRASMLNVPLFPFNTLAFHPLRLCNTAIFGYLVAPGSRWDIKDIPGFGEAYEPFGNFAFGALGGEAGIPEWQLLRGAGAAQVAHNALQRMVGTPETEIGPSVGMPWDLSGPFGDTTQDQEMIELGIQFQEDYNRGYRLSYVFLP